MTEPTKYRLVVSDQLEFTGRIILLDGAVERTFGLRLQARRTPGDQMDALLQSTPVFVDFLAGRGLTLLAWEDGQAPLVDVATGQPAPPGADSLHALLAEPGVPNALFAAYQYANGARAKLGN